MKYKKCSGEISSFQWLSLPCSAQRGRVTQETSCVASLLTSMVVAGVSCWRVATDDASSVFAAQHLVLRSTKRRPTRRVV